VLYYWPNKGFNEVYSFMNKKWRNVSHPRPLRNPSQKRKSISVLPKHKGGNKGTFNVRIKRRNKENSPILTHTRNINISNNMMGSPLTRPSMEAMRNFVSPAPFGSKKQKNFKSEIKRKSPFQHPQKMKAVRCRKDRSSMSMVRHPRVSKLRKSKFQVQQKNMSNNDLAGMLEIVVKNPQKQNTSMKGPKKSSKEK